MISTQPLLLTDFVQAASEKRTNPGVIVLTHQGQLLYLNHEATELCAEINQARLGQVARGVLPIEVVNLCHAIAEQITVDADVKAWEGTHIRLMIADLAPPMLLRGFGIPGLGDKQTTRIIIMMDRITSRKPVTIAEADGGVLLTGRKRAVVECLTHGLTNKEIARRLRITEQTVKEHIQSLMRKTGTATRTGLLARLLLKSDSVSIIGGVLVSFC